MENGDVNVERKPQEGGKVTVVCAWCGAGQEKVRPGDRVSHGICGGCAKRLKAPPAGLAGAGPGGMKNGE